MQQGKIGMNILLRKDGTVDTSFRPHLDFEQNVWSLYTGEVPLAGLYEPAQCPNRSVPEQFQTSRSSISQPNIRSVGRYALVTGVDNRPVTMPRLPGRK